MFLLEKMCGRWASLVQEVTLLLAVSAMVTSQRDIRNNASLNGNIQNQVITDKLKSVLTEAHRNLTLYVP